MMKDETREDQDKIWKIIDENPQPLMTEEQKKHHWQDVEVLDNGGEIDHYHYVIKEVRTHPSKPMRFELASRRMKLLGTALDWKHYVEILDDPGCKCRVIRIEASDEGGIL